MIALLAMIHLKYEEYKTKNSNKNSYIIQIEEILKLIDEIKYNR